jgi:hypothetical protein
MGLIWASSGRSCRARWWRGELPLRRAAAAVVVGWLLGPPPSSPFGWRWRQRGSMPFFFDCDRCLYSNSLWWWLMPRLASSPFLSDRATSWEMVYDQWENPARRLLTWLRQCLRVSFPPSRCGHVLNCVSLSHAKGNPRSSSSSGGGSATMSVSSWRRHLGYPRGALFGEHGRWFDARCCLQPRMKALGAQCTSWRIYCSRRLPKTC